MYLHLDKTSVPLGLQYIILFMFSFSPSQARGFELLRIWLVEIHAIAPAPPKPRSHSNVPPLGGQMTLWQRQYLYFERDICSQKQIGSSLDSVIFTTAIQLAQLVEHQTVEWEVVPVGLKSGQPNTHDLYLK